MTILSTSNIRVAAASMLCLVGSNVYSAEVSRLGSFRSPGFQGAKTFSSSNVFGAVNDQLAAAYDYAKPYVEAGLNQIHIDRETTEQEHLIGQLRRFEQLGADWDGEGAEAPNIESLRAASNFACLLSAGYLIPSPVILANGRAALSWEFEGFYGEIEFLSSDSAAYYFARGHEKHKGMVELRRDALPSTLAPLILG